MNPNDNKQINPADYLNQTAPKAPSKIDFFKQKPIMIGGIVLGVFILITLFAAIVGGISGGTTPVKTLSVRLSSTADTANSATLNIKNTKLRALNSDLKIYLTNTIRDYTPIMAAENIDVKKIDGKITTAESNTTMLATLENARLNAIYDRIYASEMSPQLERIMLLMRQIYNSTGNKKLKDFLDSAYTNLKPIQKQFADFNAANG